MMPIIVLKDLNSSTLYLGDGNAVDASCNFYNYIAKPVLEANRSGQSPTLPDHQYALKIYHKHLNDMAGTCINSGCTANGTKRCAACKQVSYCSSTCQKQDWQHHKPNCHVRVPAPTNDDTKVKAVMIHSQEDGGGRYSAFLLPRDDPIFKTTPAPISQKIGYPLLVHRPQDKSVRGPLADNPHATWLMIEPSTGFAPMEWQSRVGNVIIARADGGALDTSTLGAITDYISDIMEAFGDGMGAPTKYYNRNRLDKFIVDHLKMQQDYKELQLEGEKEFGVGT